MSGEHVVTPLDQGAWERTWRIAVNVGGTFVLVGLAYLILRDWIDAPIGFFQLWDTKGSLLSGLGSVWPLFAWGIAVTLALGLWRVIRREPRDHEPGHLLVKGSWFSILAGVSEEIMFRWLLLFGSMMVLKILNAITFGLVGWFYRTVLIPITDWTSFGLLHHELSAYGWLFAAAIISANVKFRDDHGYQGVIGWINAWYVGLVMFYLVFHYGLWAAIVAHAVYDLCIIWVGSVMATMQPRNHMRQLFRAIIQAHARNLRLNTWRRR